MPRLSIALHKIREEFAWVNQMPDASKCGCRHAQCMKARGHAPGPCVESPTAKLWTFRWEYFCAECRIPVERHQGRGKTARCVVGDESNWDKTERGRLYSAGWTLLCRRGR